MKAKTVKGNWSWRTKKFALPSVFLICIFFFLAGFFGSSLFSHSKEDLYGLRPRPRLLESTTAEADNYLLPAGESGDDSITSIPFQVLSWKPRALYFPKFASAEQCESIIDIAKAGLKPSTLALREGETEENTKGIRTSSGVFLSTSDDKSGTLDVIEEKIARATMIPRSHGEQLVSSVMSITLKRKCGYIGEEEKVFWAGVDRRAVQAFNILRYEIGQKYNSHYDAFNPSEYGPQKSQRLASFLLYLTDVEEGGETMFPFKDGQNMDGSYNYEECVGLRVKPRQGDGLLFYSLFHNGTIDPTSLHGSCPVMKGEKWVATKWIRDQEQYD